MPQRRKPKNKKPPRRRDSLKRRRKLSREEFRRLKKQRSPLRKLLKRRLQPIKLPLSKRPLASKLLNQSCSSKMLMAKMAIPSVTESRELSTISQVLRTRLPIKQLQLSRESVSVSKTQERLVIHK